MTWSGGSWDDVNLTLQNLDLARQVESSGANTLGDALRGHLKRDCDFGSARGLEA